LESMPLLDRTSALPKFRSKNDMTWLLFNFQADLV
jgi:hypothetical protein